MLSEASANFVYIVKFIFPMKRFISHLLQIFIFRAKDNLVSSKKVDARFLGRIVNLSDFFRNFLTVIESRETQVFEIFVAVQ